MNRNLFLNASTTTTVYSDADAVTFVTCSFGSIRASAGHQTQVTLQRGEFAAAQPLGRHHHLELPAVAVNAGCGAPSRSP